ncbi:hypothetical protein H5410_058795 [Solanum commersonii]|uniref:Uncharacterized protein n=1 Tax=Solanum commersonii TaxID=4109 RepID=A0A9J5WTR3_SOLCO|nr:hypothetical protein H5410_058795 [Solanum commersonii]
MQLLKPYYTNQNYVETEDPLKTWRYYMFILTNTDSHTIFKFHDQKNLSPFEWIVDHLHTQVLLSNAHQPKHIITQHPHLVYKIFRRIEECSNSPMVSRMAESIQREKKVIINSTSNAV